MMPAAIMRETRTNKVKFHFENPDRFLTADEAIAHGLIDADEQAQLQREVQQLGWEASHD